MNVLWFIADALRWDYARKLNFLQHWAKSGVTLDNHFAMSHCSDPNFMSMLTGFPLEEHGILSQLDTKTVDGKVIHYPSYKGIQFWLRKHYGHRSLMLGPTLPTIYSLGFDVMIAIGRKDKSFPGMVGIKQFMDESEGPWFAFIRTMDCHTPYYGGAYRRATRYTDGLIRDLFGWVKKHHPDTFIAFLSDHGESLGEHGVRGHLSTLYDVLLHTPMYVKFPGCKAGLVVKEFTRHIDLFPTIAALLGGDKVGEGRNLVPILTGEVEPQPEPSGPMYFAGDGAWREKYWNWRAVRDEKYKYMEAVHVKDGLMRFLFDIRKDPREINNLVERQEQKADEYAGKLRAKYGSEWGTQLTVLESELLLSRLRRLGYA